MQNFDEFEKLLLQNASPGIRPGLSRIERLLGLVGDPQKKFPAIHVVGTNGKGSTCAFMNSILRAAGYKTAFYSSPHLVSPGERLLINGMPLDAAEWLSCGKEIVEAMQNDEILNGDRPSYFEILTAIAFKLTEKASVDVAVVEAGLGGRLDATNTLEKILVSVITSISMDHTEFLGDTLEKIAAEKFAVVRDTQKAIYLGDNPQLCKIFDGHILLRDAEIKINKISIDGNEYDLTSPPGPLPINGEGERGKISPPSPFMGREGLGVGEVFFPSLRTELIGEYQIHNSALAVGAILLSGLKVSEQAIREGLLSARWVGRMEIISRSPLVIFDGGHNEDGVAKLVASLKKLLRGGEKIGVVYAAMKDKDIAGCLSHLSELKPSLYLTRVPGNERSEKIHELAKIAARFAWEKFSVFDDPLEALEASKKNNDATILCGSLYFVGHVKGLLLQYGKI